MHMLKSSFCSFCDMLYYWYQLGTSELLGNKFAKIPLFFISKPKEMAETNEKVLGWDAMVCCR